MFIFGNLLTAVARILDIALSFLYWVILVSALLSWVNPDPFNPIVQFLHRITEPILNPIRRMLPMASFDISPIIAFLAIVFLKSFLVRTLFDIASRMR